MIYFKRAITSLCFVAGLIGLLLASSYVFTPKTNESEFGVEDASAMTILGEEKNSIDAIVFGDSESYSNVSPMEVWKESGIPMFICGTRAQQLGYTQALVERAFKTQKPKVIFLETNTIFRRITAGNTSVDYISNYFSIFKYHNRWKVFIGGEKKFFEDDYKGYQYNSESKPYPKEKIGEYMAYTDEVAEIAQINADYVEKINNICEENGARLILLSTPSIKNWNYKRHNAVEQLAKEIGCGYWDLNTAKDQIAINWETDTRDKGDHLNYNGAVKASRYLANLLIETNMFTDKRQDPKYGEWVKSLEKYELYIEQEEKTKNNK